MHMRLNFWLCLSLLLGTCFVLVGAESQPTIFYIQLIQGTEKNTPPEPKAKLVGPKMSEKLARFRWKYYWEINQQDVKVVPGKTTKLGLKVRDLEIDLQPKEQLELRLYQKGKLVRTSRQKLQADSFEIMGGAREDDNAWFVVVRRDKPQ